MPVIQNSDTYTLLMRNPVIHEKIPPGYYDLRFDMSGNPIFTKRHMSRGSLVALPGTVTDSVVEKMTSMTSPEKLARYAELKQLPACNILMYGPPGTGKTSIAGLIADKMINEHDFLVVYTTVPRSVILTSGAFSTYGVEQKILWIVEDCEDTFESNETEWLNLLDGPNTHPRNHFLFTTNNLSEIAPRIWKRRSRITALVEVKALSVLSRQAYLDQYLRPPLTKVLDADQATAICAEMVAKTEGFVLDNLKALIQDYYLNPGITIDECVQAIRDIDNIKSE